MSISRSSLNIQKLVLIQSDFPTELTINRSSLSMVNFCGIVYVSTAISKKLLRYEEHHFSKNTSLKRKQRCILHIDKLYHLYFCIIIYKQSIQGFSHLFQTHQWPLRGDNSVAFSQVFSTANFTRSFLLFKIK